ncbi:hypothetical protein E2C01_066928 [Portunus trituberculatus]|uniref:Uncharacterized protein n=1 Tax=Portunus trituberculatus TaxID=210409 RepID=A0A5B7HS31_PORTR|nr:hypothetical protein [Portunus trituberculatus]
MERRGARQAALSLTPVLTSHRQWPFPKKMEFIENGRLKNIWSWREAVGFANTTAAQLPSMKHHWWDPLASPSLPLPGFHPLPWLVKAHKSTPNLPQ